MRSRNLPMHEPEKWALFKDYCRQDVVTEMEAEKMLSFWQAPDYVQKQWELDMKINAYGTAIDMELVNGALYCSESDTDKLMNRAREITGLDNPKSDTQLKEWAAKRLDAEIPSLDKKNLALLLQKEVPGDVREMLHIRKELGL